MMKRMHYVVCTIVVSRLFLVGGRNKWRNQYGTSLLIWTNSSLSVTLLHLSEETFSSSCQLPFVQLTSQASNNGTLHPLSQGLHIFIHFYVSFFFLTFFILIIDITSIKGTHSSSISYYITLD